MTITLSAKVESFVIAQVDSGTYSDADAVLLDAIHELEARQERERKLADLRAMIAEGEADIAAGRCRPLTPEVVAEMKQEARRRFESRRTQD